MITGVAYWAIGIPLCCLLVFWQSFGIKGIWIGPTASCLFITAAYHIIVKSMNWEGIIEDNHAAQKRDKKVDDEGNKPN